MTFNRMALACALLSELTLAGMGLTHAGDISDIATILLGAVGGLATLALLAHSDNC